MAHRREFLDQTPSSLVSWSHTGLPHKAIQVSDHAYFELSPKHYFTTWDHIDQVYDDVDTNVV